MIDAGHRATSSEPAHRSHGHATVPESEAVVAATAAVVAEHADQITATFYPDMFEAHPELLNTFNTANQAIGEQPKALAARSSRSRCNSSTPTP